MTDFNPKEYRKDQFNKKKKEHKKYTNTDEYSDLVKRNKAYKQKKQQLKDEENWEEDFDELY